MAKVILVTFAGATDPYLAAKLLNAQAKLVASASIGGIDRVITWNWPKLQESSFYSRNRTILDNPRGAGFWLWKPYIILEALREVDNDDDVILYWDVGRHRPNTFARPVTPLVRWCREHQGMFPGIPILTQGQWTRRDCFHVMDCDRVEFWNARQIQATFSLWCGPAARETVAEWLQWCRDRRCISDDENQCGLPNLPTFQEHRHDQSILTNICVMRQVEAPSAPAIPPGAWTKNLNIWADLLDLPQNQRGIEQACGAILYYEPNNPLAMKHLGIACLRGGRQQEGIQWLEKSAGQLPRTLTSLFGVIGKLERAGRLKETLSILERALAASDGVSEFSIQLKIGAIALKMGKAGRAEVAYWQALATNSKSIAAWRSLSRLLLQQCRHDEAIEALQQALRLRSNDASLHYELAAARRCAAEMDANCVWPPSVTESRRNSSLIRSSTDQLTTGRSIKVGYVCAGFGAQNIAPFIHTLLTHHGRGNGEFQIFCYEERHSSWAERGGQLEVWRELPPRDDATADMILHDELDILVDLSGNLQRDRLPILAQRLAPMQGSYLGLPGLVRLPGEDFRLSDVRLDPWESEHVIRLKRSWICYSPAEPAPPIHPAPGTSTRLLTFGCFAQAAHITATALRAWCRILRQVEGARLVLGRQCDAPGLREILLDEQVDPDRLEYIRAPTMTGGYLEAYQWIDVALDPWPCNGLAAGCEAIWMGVPLITLAGRSAPGRIGVSLLEYVQVPELIAADENQYVQIAVDLANDRTRLKSYRTSLRDRMRHSSVMDGLGLTRQIEAVYSQLCKTGSVKGSS